MALDMLLFVSKRLQAIVAALLCLAFAQLLTAEPPNASAPARVAIAG